MVGPKPDRPWFSNDFLNLKLESKERNELEHASSPSILVGLVLEALVASQRRSCSLAGDSTTKSTGNTRCTSSEGKVLFPSHANLVFLIFTWRMSWVTIGVR